MSFPSRSIVGPYPYHITWNTAAVHKPEIKYDLPRPMAHALSFESGIIVI